ncbi:MAG: hypothetical protein IMZ50_04950 [Candidatus Atribacteria bacterium]|nr:hypothetical protein [Candidatus Atribacteria bacterium]
MIKKTKSNTNSGIKIKDTIGNKPATFVPPSKEESPSTKNLNIAAIICETIATIKPKTIVCNGFISNSDLL